MRKRAVEQLLITVLGVLIAFGVAAVAGASYLKWSVD